MSQYNDTIERNTKTLVTGRLISTSSPRFRYRYSMDYTHHHNDDRFSVCRHPRMLLPYMFFAALAVLNVSSCKSILRLD
jgi:hypothetical protein